MISGSQPGCRAELSLRWSSRAGINRELPGLKTGQPIAKSVWAIVSVGLVVIVLTIWADLRRHKAAPEQPAPVVKTSTHAVLPARIIASAPADAASTIASGLPPVIPISLAGVPTLAENGSWLRDKDYLLVPHRSQTFGGVEFLMDGMIQMQGCHYHYRAGFLQSDFAHQHRRSRAATGSAALTHPVAHQGITAKSVSTPSGRAESRAGSSVR